MTSTPHLWWPTALLALALAGDAALSVRPPLFIRNCLRGVKFPEDWWWTLIVIKSAAAAGLLLGLHYAGMAFTTNVAVIGYFLCACYAHVRADFLKQEFWVNCLGMLGLSVGALALAFA
ncbi:DoxX family protein [Nocardioides jejuensis]|uniref:DoxX family protein n=1 Tax=Nocardioides jejuensis TaxID=2502782 RepID=A0A4R1CL25_9ACTN|nr:DoxX family protein [Nocardioides jejuensis]TCJ30916.1 hypothetical protein EPD65_02445 [Nocardioides jejuensis]